MSLTQSLACVRIVFGCVDPYTLIGEYVIDAAMAVGEEQ
jgi:short subunit dehydrogenase-like uncharacterized protein